MQAVQGERLRPRLWLVMGPPSQVPARQRGVLGVTVTPSYRSLEPRDSWKPCGGSLQSTAVRALGIPGAVGVSEGGQGDGDEDAFVNQAPIAESTAHQRLQAGIALEQRAGGPCLRRGTMNDER